MNEEEEKEWDSIVSHIFKLDMLSRLAVICLLFKFPLCNDEEDY